MGALSAQHAVCYKCNKTDKKGNLQMCLGWHLLKRVEDDVDEFNRLQEESVARETSQTAVSLPEAPPAAQLDHLGQAALQQEAGAAELAPASYEVAASQEPAAEPELRDTPRFQLFNRGTSLQAHANCQFVEEGQRHFHQTCLGRGAHLNMSRKILHWSGKSNSNKRKKADKLHQRDSVKVTGRHALCGDCLQAFADHINIKVEEALPPESDPQRRQVKVNSRHRLHHAAELPALGAAGNMVWTVYVSSAGRVGIYQTDNFAELRENNEEVNMAAQHLENLLRKQASEEKAADSEAGAEQRRKKRRLPVGLTGHEPPAVMEAIQAAAADAGMEAPGLDGQGPTHLQQLLDAPVAQQQLAHEQQLDPSAPHHQQAVPQDMQYAPVPPTQAQVHEGLPPGSLPPQSAQLPPPSQGLSLAAAALPIPLVAEEGHQ